MFSLNYLNIELRNKLVLHSTYQVEILNCCIILFWSKPYASFLKTSASLRTHTNLNQCSLSDNYKFCKFLMLLNNFGRSCTHYMFCMKSVCINTDPGVIPINTRYRRKKAKRACECLTLQLLYQYFLNDIRNIRC